MKVFTQILSYFSTKLRTYVISRYFCVILLDLIIPVHIIDPVGMSGKSITVHFVATLMGVALFWSTMGMGCAGLFTKVATKCACQALPNSVDGVLCIVKGICYSKPQAAFYTPAPFCPHLFGGGSFYSIVLLVFCPCYRFLVSYNFS